MIVAFWSNVRGIGCNSTHLACFSVWYALMHPLKRAVLFENHKTPGGLDAMLYKPQVQERYPYYRSGGLGSLLRRLGGEEEMSVLELDWLAERYIGERLMYFPIGADLGPEQLNYHLEKHLGSFLTLLEKKAHMVWIDLQATAMTNRPILNTADRVVISLPQNRAAWDAVFDNHRDIHRKAFYLIGNYEEESELTPARLCREYGVRKERIATVPHSVSMMDAVSKGVMIPFLMRCFHSETGDAPEETGRQLHEAAERLFGWMEPETAMPMEDKKESDPALVRNIAGDERGNWEKEAGTGVEAEGLYEKRKESVRTPFVASAVDGMYASRAAGRSGSLCRSTGQ